MNITSLGETLTKNGVKIRIDISELSTHIAHDFYNQRLLNQFKKLLKEKGIPYNYKRLHNCIVVEHFNLVLFALNDGRFQAYNKASYNTNNGFYKNIAYSVNFQANSTIEIINKLLRFNIIGPGSAVKMVEEKVLPRSKFKKPPSVEVLIS